VLDTLIEVVVALPNKFHPSDTGIEVEVLLALIRGRRNNDKTMQLKVLTKKL